MREVRAILTVRHFLGVVTLMHSMVLNGQTWFKTIRDYAYMQAHALLTEQSTIEGHSVRGMYYVTAA